MVLREKKTARGGKSDGLFRVGEPEPDGEKASQVDLVARLDHPDVHRPPQPERAARRAQVLENRTSALPENSRMTGRDQREVQPEVDALRAAEDELGPVNLDLGSAVHR